MTNNIETKEINLNDLIIIRNKKYKVIDFWDMENDAKIPVKDFDYIMKDNKINNKFRILITEKGYKIINNYYTLVKLKDDCIGFDKTRVLICNKEMI